MTAISLTRTHTAAPARQDGIVASRQVGGQQGGFAILHGSLAPEGCVARLEGFDTDPTIGQARVFASIDAAHDAITAGAIAATDMIVIRNAAAEATGFAALIRALAAKDLSEVTVITDGRIGSDAAAQSFGARIIGNVAPCAADGGPIARVQDGDTIQINIAARQIELISDHAAEAAQNFTQKGSKLSGPLAKYARLVTSAD